MLWWQPPGYQGDRHLAMLGRVAVGAVFPPTSGRYWRWRAWISVCRNPVDGVAPSEAAAKGLVETHLREFLTEAQLIAAVTP